MQWSLLYWLRSLRAFVARPAVLSLLITIDVAAYFGGLLYWYGGYIAETAPPIWAWPFIPDCPLFGLLGGLALLMVTSRTFWGEAARRRASRALVVLGIVIGALWLSTYLSVASPRWAMQSAMLALCSWSLLLFGLTFTIWPRWLLLITALGSIKYGIWTVTAWGLYWQNTAFYLGTPLVTFESLFMTLTHIGMIVQGLFLLLYFKPTRVAAFVALFWLALSDFVDYALGYHPPIYVPDLFIPLPILQWSTIGVTVLLGAWSFWQGLQPTSKPDASIHNSELNSDEGVLLEQSVP